LRPRRSRVFQDFRTESVASCHRACSFLLASTRFLATTAAAIAAPRRRIFFTG